MSDSFADLWNSSAPSKPTQPQTLGAKVNTNVSSNNTGRRPQYDAFSMLASSSPSSSSPRSGTPSTTQNTAQQSTARSPASTLSKGDAFGDLLSVSINNASKTANMSIAERASRAEQLRQEAFLKQQQSVKQQAAHWDGLDSLATSSFSGSPSHQSSSSAAQDDDWLFGSQSAQAHSLPQTSTPKAPAPVIDDHDDWGLGDFTSQSTTTKPSKSSSTPQASGSLWDLDSFDSGANDVSASSSALPRKSKTPSRTDSPGDFDFGDREQGLLDEDSGDEDDILGDLSRPAESLRSSASPAPPTRSNGKQIRSSSPPPHVIGQIVEMGFSPQQARVALAATESGIDVQAALETLLSNGAGTSSPPPERQPAREQRRSRPRNEERFEDDDHEDVPPHRGSRHRARPPRDAPSPPSAGQNDYQQQADKLLAQANSFGISVFNRANALFSQGKEKVQKAYEERAAASRSTSSLNTRGTPDGRPRWMQEAMDRESERHAHDEAPQEERDDSEVLPPRPPQQQRARPNPEPASRPEVKTAELFSDDAPKAYVSPFRRGGASRNGTPSTSAAASSSPAVPPAARRPSPITLVQRQTISASPSAISSSNKHKSTGTEMFKLGRYGEAESAYSSAITQLPESHLLRIPLLNNRALTRLKTGDTSGTIEDCTAVISIIGPSYHPSREAKVTKEDEGSSVDLADALVKAWKRRAEAYEGKEKWDLARQDWEAIVSSDFAGKLRHDAVTGASRCRKMLTVAQAPPQSAPKVVKPKPAPKRPPPRSAPPSEALNRLKQANQAAEAEDQARHELKDAIDARLSAWKNGKETNLRALIASLDSVLWPELGWQKVGMAELVTPNQVKIRYTKAIAKLHPDKLNVNNTTLEQRMIANGVFGTLNEAWIAFKP